MSSHIPGRHIEGMVRAFAHDHEQLDIEGYLRGAQDARRAARESGAIAADEERSADRLAGMLAEAHDAMRDLCPACRELVDERLAEGGL